MSCIRSSFVFLTLITVIITVLSAPARADTNGSELQITEQPDQLILQLGSQWAGVQFELRTDAGVFPVPIVVDQAGVLKMDLGGSKVYILSCLVSPVSIPKPEQPEQITPPPSPPTEPIPENESGIVLHEEPVQTSSDIPTSHLILFLLGSIAAIGSLIVIWYFKRRRQVNYDDEYE